MHFLTLIFACLSMTSAWAFVAKKDIVYDTVNGTPLKLDIYRPAFHWSPAPVLFFIHGGCFNSGSKDDIPATVKAMADEGFVVVSVGYRLSPQAKYPAAVKDVQAAVRYMRQNHLVYRIDANRMASFGASAGGYLAAVLGVRPLTDRNGKLDQYSQRVQRVADWFGRTDFTLSQSEGFDCAVDFLGKPRNEQTMKDFEEASLMPYVNEKAALFFIAHGTADKQVHPVHSSKLYDALMHAGRDPFLLWVKDAGHGFSDLQPWKKTKKFLLEL